MIEPVEIFLASRNPKKIAEMERILGETLPGLRVLGLDDVPAYDEPVEDEPDFAGNALLKARAGFAVSGLPSIADDSGLCVDALNGMPGVLSARWSGPPKDDARNNRLLLDQLADVPDERRGAEFRCAVALVHAGPDGQVREEVVDGVMRGRVIRELRGEGGFGYDVLFVPDDQDGELTSAEMTAEQKDLISHRGKSVRAIAPIVTVALAG
ncbi:non-canonical purine NTP pyrophosphatase [Nocardioides marmoriginsengisoli]|uniref:dITP/XTP pyrophosphatase n=1 Tax=Nocardioides marmoriginsengisoli TaxID=661483 RepID=A0A3N0CI92_9ACTN|nr:non-canonical purine NTP pyrophosphatase [Nocardioides marmoriginsengisoli]RNL63150.1 non-canonical purine NTP pyrophosphatase [Nocardioides marmoriginsengisoli]